MILLYVVLYYFFFFKQKTAYEMRISDWSSDVCSSDLRPEHSIRCDQAEMFINPSASKTFLARSSIRSASDLRSGMPFETFLSEIGRASCRERVCQYV